MYAFRKHAALNKQKIKAESYSFISPKLPINEDPRESLLEQDKLPISKNKFASTSVINLSFNKLDIDIIRIVELDST